MISFISRSGLSKIFCISSGGLSRFSKFIIAGFQGLLCLWARLLKIFHLFKCWAFKMFYIF